MLRANVDGLDSDTILDVSGLCVIADLVSDNLRFAESVHESRATSPGSSCKNFDAEQAR